MKSGDIVWWTTRVRGRESKRWTAFPVIFLRRGDFTHVQGLIGRWRGREFSVVNNEITSYIPMGTQLALGAKKYLAQFEVQSYARRQKLTQLKGPITENDSDRWRARHQGRENLYRATYRLGGRRRY